MAKYIKRYNEQTEKWELVSAPDITIVHRLEDGEKISDNEVVITNYNYSESGETVSLSDTLTTISEDISRLQRNVSWLGEHGGGGGGGGSTGGTPTSYGIEIISPIIENNAVYISTTSFSVRFKLTGGTMSDEFQYRYIYDGTETSEYTNAKNEEERTVTIRNINSVTDSSIHSFQLEAVTPLGTTVRQSFRIYENSLSIALGSSNTLLNGEVIINMNGNGLVWFDVKNGIMNSQTNLHYSANGSEEDVPYQNDTTSVKSVPVNIWKVIDKASVKADDLFVVTVFAQATYGMTVNNKTDNLVFNVRIRNADEMVIYFDGLTYESDVEEGQDATSVELNGRLKFNFRVYFPVLVTDTVMYYAIKLVSPDGEEVFVAGETFDDNAYSSNVLDAAQKYIPVQIPLASYYVYDNWKIIVKAWASSDRTCNETRTGVFNIIETNSDIFPRQHAKRYAGIGSASADTCLFAWDSASMMKNDTWTSSIRHYMPSYGAADEISTTASIKTYNTNGRSSGFITSESVPYMRLQNEAYAIADMTDYPIEIGFMTNSSEDYEHGFDISITFKADDLADDTKTVFLWGSNDGNGDITNGVKISLSKAEWYVHGANGIVKHLVAHTRPGKKNTVDFLYDGTRVYILVDGIVCAAEIIGSLDQTQMYQFGTKAYFATDVVNGQYTNFSDTNIYEFAVYTKKLNMLQIAVNGKNARLDGQISDETILQDYSEWKVRNLIYNIEGDKNKAMSYLIDSETGEFNYDPSKLSDLQAASPIPIIMIDANGTDLTEDSFHLSYADNKAITAKTHNCLVTYYVNGRTVSFRAIIKLQGTSTLGYYIKNLELLVNENCSEDNQKKKLLQVREDWFPENEYTLKADVVDSAHANNATIGYWINHECKIMSDNPAMEGFTDAWRPKDINANGAPAATHPDTRPDKLGEEINFDEKVTIKHNLEGFPVLMLIRFAQADKYDLIGIYSFNLGRYSCYNMGMKFLKEFSRRTNDNTTGLLPALIDHYVEYGKDEPFGTNAIKTSDIFSYEFDATADDNDENHQTWTQDDIKVLQFYGGFNFNGAAADPATKVTDDAPIWSKLKNLFTLTANMGGATSNLASRGFGGKQKYTCDGEKLIPAGGNPYVPSETAMEDFDNTLSVNNAAAYFVIATALGMVDSLGKNLTLRTWDGGTKWWTAFYDMDSALALSNEGDEGISETAYIDSFSNVIDGTGVSQLTIKSHDSNSKYGAYNSKLWAIFRDPLFLYINHGGKPYYDPIWTVLRSRGGALDTYSKFVSLMERQIGNCGELIYNYDYESKYIGPGANISMLHGTRVEYVRNWLKKRLYFLDGVFEDSDANTGSFVDSPFYLNKFNASNRGHNGSPIGFISYIFRTTTPVFIKINTGNAPGQTDSAGKYFIPAYTDTEVHTIEHTSTKQTSFTSSNLITKFDGLDGIQVVSLNTNQNFNDYEILTSLVDFNISGAMLLQNNPIIFEYDNISKNGVFMFGGESSLETINVSNTAFESSESTTFQLNLTDYQKIKRIDISNSPVTNLLLPNSVLQYLNVRNSNINTFVMQNQPILQSVDFTGCQKIQDIDILNCSGLQNISMSSIQNLARVSVNGCSSIEEITISDDPSLSNITISNCSSLRKITVRECVNDELSIFVTNCLALEEVEISGCNGRNAKIKINSSPLKSLRIQGFESSNVIELPKSEDLSGLTYFELNNVYNFGGVKYEDGELEIYENEYVFDLTPLVGLPASGLVLRNVSSLKYMRVGNDDGTNKLEPFEITRDTFKEGTKGIIKIFGYIKILSSPFDGMQNFYLNHDTRYSDPSQTESDFVYLSEDRYYTNVTFDTADISGWFAGTNCDINDVYYILFMCNGDTQNFSNLFSGCRNVITDDEVPIRADAFHKCRTNSDIVKSIDGIFNGCQIGGTLSSPMYDEHGEETGGNVLLDPLIKNLVTFNNVFSGDYKINTLESCFFPEGCKIKTLKGFNPGVAESYYLQDYVLLTNLTELEVIESSYNDVMIDFGTETYDATELFKNNTKLVSIKDSFVNISGYGSIRNIFGECSDEENAYPSNLSSITHSFIFKEGGYHASINGEDESGVVFPIGNSLFKRIKSSITYIGNGYSSNRTNGDYYANYTTTCGSFTGPGLKKYLANDNFTFEDGDTIYEPDDCNGEGFPYRIFEGCTKLKEVPSLFEDVINLRGYNAEEGKESDIFVSLPGRMFDPCEKLTNISRIFRRMSSSIRCTLTKEGFKTLSLVNVESAFDGVSVIGSIPFKLFYQEQELPYSENAVRGLTAAQATALGITNDSGTIASMSSSDYTVFEGTYKAINATIQNMGGALSNLTATSMTQYKASIVTLDDLLEDNPLYNPLKYLLNGNNYSLNEAFDPYKKVWNKYVFDNDENFHVTVSELSANIPTDEYGYPIVNVNDMPEEFTSQYIAGETSPEIRQEYLGMPVQDSDIDIFKVINYMCPPDVFRYCENADRTNVSYALAGCSGVYDYDTRTISGLRGKIPTMIFEPLAALTAVTGVFSSNVGIFPYRWATGTNVEDMGTAYYPDLLAPLVNVSDISAMFSGTKMWGHTAIPATFFGTVPLVTSLSSFWSNVTWVTGNSVTVANQMLPASIFSPLSRLTNVSYTLAGNGISCVPMVTRNILSTSLHKSINNCNGFMQNENQTRGSVPEFWDWGSYEPKQHEGTYRNGQDGYIQGVDNANAIAEHGGYWRAS